MNIFTTDYNGIDIRIEKLNNILISNIDLEQFILFINNINYGNFYIDKIKDYDKLAKKLIINIDSIIFEKYRYINSNKNVIKYLKKVYLNKKNIELNSIYKEYLSLDKSTKKYKEYSCFLEFEFNRHGIPDIIRNEFLKFNNKSILDYYDIDLEIKSMFSVDINKTIGKFEYNDLEERKKSINNELSKIDEYLESINVVKKELLLVYDDIIKNEEIINKINIISADIKKSFLFKKIKLKREINNLSNNLVFIDEDSIINDYCNKLSLNNKYNSIKSLLEHINYLHNSCNEKYNNYIVLSKEIENKLLKYKNSIVDISYLIERVDNI